MMACRPAGRRSDTHWVPERRPPRPYPARTKSSGPSSSNASCCPVGAR
jgi:hypothetical protein